MPKPRLKHRPAVHKSTAGILNPIPEAVDPVGSPPWGLTNNTVALPLAGESTEPGAGCSRLFQQPATLSVPGKRATPDFSTGRRKARAQGAESGQTTAWPGRRCWQLLNGEAGE